MPLSIHPKTMKKLNIDGRWLLMGRRSLKPFSGGRVFSSAAKQWSGGVSMVQGASRGIGLQFVTQLLEKRDKGCVVATCRNPDGATGLHELKNKFPGRLDIHQLDLMADSTMEATAKAIKDKYGYLNLLINASGILSIPEVLQPETTLNKVQRDSLLLTYEVNAVGPTLVAKKSTCGPFSRPEAVLGQSETSPLLPVLVPELGRSEIITSEGGTLIVMKTISVEFARKKDPIVCILLHPGTVDTDLSRPFQRNVPEGKLFTKEFSVEKLLGIIDNAKKSDNGKFFAWEGQEIPW